jgi:hypothetical protein
MRMMVCLAVLLVPVPAFALPAPPTREIANECRLAAYQAYPKERPGKSPGSGARYQFYRDCVEKRSNAAAPPAAEPQLAPKQP